MPTANTPIDAMINSRAFLESIACKRCRLRIVSIAPPAGRSKAITDTLSGDHGLPEFDRIRVRRCTVRVALPAMGPLVRTVAVTYARDVSACKDLK
jgi:hypothetical protein